MADCPVAKLKTKKSNANDASDSSGHSVMV